MATTEEDERVSYFGGCHCKAVRFEVRVGRKILCPSRSSLFLHF